METAFEQGASFVHRLDPRVRLLAAAAFSIVVALATRFQVLLPAGFGALLLAALAGLPSGAMVRRIMVVNGLILLLWFFLPFTVSGRTWFHMGPLAVTREGILYATRITLKSNAIVLILIVLVSTMPVYTLGRAMRSLRVPRKLVQLLFFTYRYVHVILREYQRLSTAARIRGFQPRTNLHTYRTYALLLGMLLVKSYERAERVRAAMLCRGFQGRFYDLADLEIRTGDIVMAGFLGLGIATLALLEWLP